MSKDEFLLVHPCGLAIRQGLRESDLADVAGLRRNDMHTGYVWYSLPHGEIAEKTVAIHLCFHQGDLFSLSLAISDPNRYGEGWSDWSQEREELLAKDTGKWLARIGFPVGEYSWGTVYAGYDAKGASGGGGVQFAPSKRR